MKVTFFLMARYFLKSFKAPVSNTIYGEIEYSGYITLTGKQSRKGNFLSKVFGPTDRIILQSGCCSENLYAQQRGFKNNQEGPTGDIRELQEKWSAY